MNHACFSETHGATQFFVEQKEEELTHVDLPAYALRNVDNCSQSLSENRSDILQACALVKRERACETQYYFAVLCGRPEIVPTTPPPESKHSCVDLYLLLSCVL